MLENYFSIPTSHKSCIEKMVILDKTRDLLKYSLSNSLDDIQIAIYSRTGYNVNLEKAVWKLNPGLSISVKHLMNSYNVNYSMTMDIKDKANKFVVVNMRVGDKWFITGYDEINNKLVNWELIRTLTRAVKIAMNILNDNNSSSENDTGDE